MQLLIYRYNTDKYQRGDIVEARASSTPFGGAEPNSFVVLEIPEPMNALRQYANQHWRTQIQHEVVNSNSALDGHRIRLYSNTARGAQGALRAKIEMFINNWGGTVFSFAQNEVVFDITIYNAIISQNFWDRADMSGIVFTELSYTQAGGIHQIQADYSALAVNPTYVEAFMDQQGCTIISHANRVIVFEATRAQVRDKFLADIKYRGREDVARFRYCVLDAMVTAAENAGGVLQTTLAEVQANLIDKVTE